jgi:polyisoprenyl-teichoic acid--peptidoglycan teichoic acid transferase
MKKVRKISKFRVASLLFLILFLVSMFSNALLPVRYELVIASVSLLLFVFVLLKKSRSLNIVFIVLMIIPTVGLFYSQNILNRLFDNSKYETNLISFVATAKSEITLSSINRETVFGVSSAFDSDNIRQVNEDLKSKFDFSVTLNKSDSDFSVIQGLYDGTVGVGVIDNAVIDTIIESFPDFKKDFVVLWSIERKIDRVDITKEVQVDKDSFIVLVSGIDINGPISLRSRSDVNILLIVNPKRSTITMISIPRDMFLPFACKNDAMDKLTHSGIYGINCTVMTVENFLDIEINYYVRMNFTSFIKIIDVIGNINVYSEYSFTASDKSFSFVRGMNVMNSDQALAFARERKSFEAGDVQRGLNQQEIIKSVIKKLISPSTLGKIDKIVNSISKSLDTNLKSADVQKLISMQIDKNIEWKFASYHVSGTESLRETFSIPGRNLFVVIPLESSLENIKLRIRDSMK